MIFLKIVKIAKATLFYLLFLGRNFQKKMSGVGIKKKKKKQEYIYNIDSMHIVFCLTYMYKYALL